MNAETIPAGYRKDGKGRLIPEAQIKPIDLARDQLVQEIVAGARKCNSQIAAFKKQAFEDIDALVQLSGEQYGVSLGGRKGNVVLHSLDGRYRVIRAISEYLTFDERLQAAKKLIDECLTEWSGQAPSELRLIVQDAFDVDQQGKISTGKILSLRRYNIEDKRWKSAMQAIGDAIQVIGTKPYIRVYERDEQTGDYDRLSLEIPGA